MVMSSGSSSGGTKAEGRWHLSLGRVIDRVYSLIGSRAVTTDNLCAWLTRFRGQYVFVEVPTDDCKEIRLHVQPNDVVSWDMCSKGEMDLEVTFRESGAPVPRVGSNWNNAVNEEYDSEDEHHRNGFPRANAVVCPPNSLSNSAAQSGNVSPRSSRARNKRNANANTNNNTENSNDKSNKNTANNNNNNSSSTSSTSTSDGSSMHAIAEEDAEHRPSDPRLTALQRFEAHLRGVKRRTSSESNADHGSNCSSRSSSSSRSSTTNKRSPRAGARGCLVDMPVRTLSCSNLSTSTAPSSSSSHSPLSHVSNSNTATATASATADSLPAGSLLKCRSSTHPSSRKAGSLGSVTNSASSSSASSNSASSAELHVDDNDTDNLNDHENESTDTESEDADKTCKKTKTSPSSAVSVAAAAAAAAAVAAAVASPNNPFSPLPASPADVSLDGTSPLCGLSLRRSNTVSANLREVVMQNQPRDLPGMLSDDWIKSDLEPEEDECDSGSSRRVFNGVHGGLYIDVSISAAAAAVAVAAKATAAVVSQTMNSSSCSSSNGGCSSGNSANNNNGSSSDGSSSDSSDITGSKLINSAAMAVASVASAVSCAMDSPTDASAESRLPLLVPLSPSSTTTSAPATTSLSNASSPSGGNRVNAAAHVSSCGIMDGLFGLLRAQSPEELLLKMLEALWGPQFYRTLSNSIGSGSLNTRPLGVGAGMTNIGNNNGNNNSNGNNTNNATGACSSDSPYANAANASSLCANLDDVDEDPALIRRMCAVRTEAGKHLGYVAGTYSFRLRSVSPRAASDPLLRRVYLVLKVNNQPMRPERKH